MVRHLTLAALLLLSACLSREEAAQRRAERDAKDGQACEKLGLAGGSEAFEECRARVREGRLRKRIDESTFTFNPYRGAPDQGAMH